MDILIAENISNNTKNTKANRKKIQLNNKIIHCARLQRKHFIKIKVKKQKTKSIKTKVNQRLTISINIDAVKQQIFNTKKKLAKNHSKNTKTSNSCESLINIIAPTTNNTNKQLDKIPSNIKQKNGSNCCLMERKKNRRHRKSSNQPPLKVNTVCLNMSLNSMYYKNNFILIHSFNNIEFLNMFEFLPSLEFKVIDQTYACNYNHTFPSCLNSNILQPDDSTIEENYVHNSKQTIYKNKNKTKSDKNCELNIFKPLLLQSWWTYDPYTQTLFFTVNELKKLKKYYSEMREIENISSTHRKYSKKTIRKEASLIKELFFKISETKKKHSVYESNLCMIEKVSFSPKLYSKTMKNKRTRVFYDSYSKITSKIYYLIIEIEKLQSYQKSNSKMTNIKKLSRMYSKLFKIKALLSSFKITYIEEALSLPKTYSEVTAKFRLSLPIIQFKNTKIKILRKLNLFLNKLCFKAGKAPFILSNSTKFINIKYCFKKYFKMIIISLQDLRKLYSKMSLMKKFSPPKTYSQFIAYNKLFLLKKFSIKNIRNQQFLSKVYSNNYFKGTLSLLKIYPYETIQDKRSIFKFYNKAKSKLSMSITYSKVNLKKRLSISNKYSEKYPSLPITYLKKNMMKKFSFSNRYFKDTVKKELTLLNTCLENSVEKELLQPNKYSVEVIKNRLNLPKANLNLSIKNIVSVPNTHFEVTIDEKCIKNVLNINSKMVVKKKKKSLRLNPQQITTDEPIVSILDEATTTKITPQKKKFLVGLGLSSCVHSEKKNVRSRLSKKRKIHPKTINIDNKEKTKQSNHDRTSSEKVKRTYPSKKSNCKKDDQKHTVIPTLISAEKPLGSSINIDHSCIPECSSCNRKFDLLETPFHIAQIKNPDKQKACLENASHLIGSDSCLCTGCYQAIEKRTSIKNLKKRACIIMACEQTVSIDFNSKWMDIIKSTLLSNKITLRVQTKEEGAMHKIPVCNAHYEQILFISQCQLCGNRTIQKYKLHKSVVKRYQLTLDRDEIPITIKYDILICKPCHIYLLLPRDKSTKMSLELAKHCNASKTRIINHCRLKLKGLEPMKLEKCEINTKKTEGDDQLLTVKSLPTKKSNIFTEDSSITFKPVSSVLEFVNTTIAITTNTIRTRPTMTRSIITTPEAEKPMSSVLTKSTKILSSLIKSTTESTSIQPSTTVVTTTIETAPLMTTRTMIKAPISTVLTSAAKNLSALKFNQKTQLKFLDKRPPVPRNKKYIVKHLTVTKNYRNHHMPVHKLTLLDGKIKILVKKPKTRVDKSMTPVEKSTTLVKKSMVPFDKFAVPFDRPMTQVHKSIIPVGKPTIQVDKLMTPVEKPTIPVDKTSTPVATLVNKPKIPDNKPIIVNHRSKPVFIPVLKPFFTSKFSAPKNYVKTPDLVPPIKLPTEIKTDQSLKNTLDLRPTSPHIEFSKSNRRQASPSILSSSTTTPDIIQLYKNLKTAYPSGMEFVNHLLKLESCRNLGDLTVKNNKTIDHQRKSYTKNTSPRIIHSLQKPKEYKMPSHINGHCNDLTNIGYLSNKCEVSEVDKNSDSLIIPVKTTSKSSYKPEQESISPKINVVHKPSLLHDGDDNEKHVIALRISTTAMPVTTIVTPVTTNVTPVTTATIKALTNIISAASPISSTIVEEITASEELTTIEMASLATNTTDLITAVADSTTTIMDTEISTITDTVAVTSDITSTVNDNIDNSIIADSTVVEEYKTLTMITTQASTTTNTASEVSSTIIGDSITDIATTVIDDSASANINSESSTITNAITVEIPTSTITVTDVSTTSCVSNNISDITASTISNTSEFTSNKNTEDKLVPTGSTESIVNNISNISTSISSEIVKASPAKLLSLPSSKVSQISAIRKPKHPLKLINIKRLNTIKLKSAITSESIVWKMGD